MSDGITRQPMSLGEFMNVGMAIFLVTMFIFAPILLMIIRHDQAPAMVDRAPTREKQCASLKTQVLAGTLGAADYQAVGCDATELLPLLAKREGVDMQPQGARP